ncbi:MAG: M20/M25/M40 family metallo-hydrolase [Chloroflexi bacterium]|nr:M20/M25/M40 family metallo-hydrolase [Chloroflexota bacterium]
MNIRPDELFAHINSEELVALAAGLARIPSEIPNEGAIAEFLAAEMRKSGAFDEVHMQDVVAGRPNVIGIVRGSGGGPNLLLNGHIDTGAPAGDWSRDPYDAYEEDGYLYGFGLTDMKGAVACLVKAAEAVARADVRPTGDLVVTAVVHHDVCGLGTKFFLESNDRPFAMCINGEPTGLRLQLAHGGAWQFELTTHGIAEHISRRDGGVDATKKMIKLLAALDESALTFDPAQALEGLPRLVVGQINGGTAASRTADRCTARGDVRIVPGMTAESLTADFRQVMAEVAKDDPEFRADLRTLVYQRPFRIEPDASVVALTAQAHRDVNGAEPETSTGLPVCSYVTDSSDIVRHGIPTVVYGPSNWRMVPDERISIAEMVAATKVYALAAARVVTGQYSD